MSTNGGVGGPRGAQTQSFNREGRPIPAMNRPKQIFDMLFVTSSKDAAAKLARSKSALDLLISNASSLKQQLSKHDRETLKQYLDAVRDTEVKLAKAQKWPRYTRPHGGCQQPASGCRSERSPDLFSNDVRADLSRLPE